MEKLLWVAAATFVVNVPFGYWRAGSRKFSVPWFVAIHGAVPLVAALRIGFGLGWRLENLPVLVGSYFLGQFLGARLRHVRDRRRSVGAGTLPS